MLNILNANIAVTEVVNAVKKIKSPLLEGIQVEFVQSSIDIIKPDLTILFNYILSREIYPDSCCEGLRVAIHIPDICPITIQPVISVI